MQYREFGKTKEKVSAIGFGCMRLPVIDNKADCIDTEKTDEMLNYAMEHGVNYFDTAPVYHRPMHQGTWEGNSEKVLGNCFKGSKREKVFLATKLSHFGMQKPEEMQQMLDHSLKSLQTDRIDFYLIHSLNKLTWEKLKGWGVEDFLLKNKKAGKIRHLGFSFHDSTEAFKHIVDDFDAWEFAQIQYNFLDTAAKQQAGTEGLHYAGMKDLGMVVMEPLRGGKLASKLPAEIAALWRQSAHDWTPARRGLTFVMNDPYVSVVLSGMNSIEQVRENINIAENTLPNGLTQHETALYDKVRALYSERIAANCTGCQYCLPCPHGVNIPENFNVLNDLKMFENEQLAKSGYLFIPPEGRAENCVACGVCMKKCPQHLEIPTLLKKLVEEIQ